MNDEELRANFELLHHGDQTAFEEIYNEMKTPIYTVVLRIMQDRELAEDIMQEVFIKLFLSPPESSIRKPRAYIFQIARNLAIDGLKKQPKYADIDCCENLMHDSLHDFSTKLDVESALRTLPLIEIQIVTMHINGGLKFREVADIVEMPLGTVLWKYQQAIGKLRLILDGGAL